MSATSGLLVVKTYCPHLGFARLLDELPRILGAHGGICLIARQLHEVVTVEAGSVPAHVLVLGFADAARRDAAWPGLEAAMRQSGAMAGPRPPIVLAMAGVPEAGLGPDIPTSATVPVTPSLAPPAYLLIEGTASDQTRMNQYRDIILPMMAARASYYLAFELGGDVQVLSGSWKEAIFAISRWPSMGHALDFWLSRRYQSEAIPLRLGIGNFDVVCVLGSAS